MAVDEGSEHTLSIWDWARGGDKGCKVTETKCATETVVAAEFHPLETGTIVSVGKGHVNFWQLDSTALAIPRAEAAIREVQSKIEETRGKFRSEALTHKTGLFDQRDKPKYVTCLAFSYTGDLLTGDSNGNVFVWGRGYNAVTKALRKVHDGPIFGICVMMRSSSPYYYRFHSFTA